MSLAVLPGAAPVVGTISTSAGAVRGLVGKDKYESNRAKFTIAYSVFTAFVPIAPLLWPIQIPLLVLFTLLLIYIGLDTGIAFACAYLAQAVLMIFLGEYIIDIFLRDGLGV